MKTIKADITPGACGLHTTVWAEVTQNMTIRLHSNSQCRNVRRLIDALPEINAYEELFKPLCDIIVMQLADRYLSHRTCMVPVGILKAMEAAAGLALPTDIAITLTETETIDLEETSS
ncbi:MAG: hypothetical protein JXB47_14670 [Anaerolineae bacterium]|nr:hypothetical protein [Anaerolineae bacterium]